MNSVDCFQTLLFLGGVKENVFLFVYLRTLLQRYLEAHVLHGFD